MRIAWVVPGGVDPGGRERVVPCWLWQLQRLAARHEVVVFVASAHNASRRYSLLGATVVDLGTPSGPAGLRLTSHHRALASAVAQHGPFDVIHGFWGVPAGVLAATVGRRANVPSIVTFDSGELANRPEIDYGLQRTWRGRLQARIASRRASQVTVSSEYMLNLARAHGITPALAPVGVDTAIFANENPRPHRPPWRLIHVASVNRVKDQTTLLNALKRIVHRLPDTHLDVIGEDTLGGAIQNLAQRLGVDRHVTFHGFLPTDRLVPFYHRAHVFVQSSRHEAAGIAVVEAAAARVPTVGTRVGYVSDWAPDAALAVEIGDDAALADAVVGVLEHPEDRERLAAAARERAAMLDADKTTARWEELYRSVAAGKRAQNG
jgi:glycosyltransferase involved in cell wall biosynthesis